MLLLIVLEPEMKQESWTESEKEGEKKKLITLHLRYRNQKPTDLPLYQRLPWSETIGKWAHPGKVPKSRVRMDVSPIYHKW